MNRLYVRLWMLSRRYKIEWVKGFGWSVTHPPKLGGVYTIHALPEKLADAWQSIDDDEDLQLALSCFCPR